MIQSLDRGIKILDLMAEKNLVGVVEAASFLGINKSSAFRLLDTLRANSLVEKDKTTDKYKICARILKYSNAFMDNSIGRIIHPYLEKLVAVTKENAHCCVFSEGKIIVIDQIRGKEIINITAHVGREEKIYCTSIGKAIFAFLPDDIQEGIIDSIELLPMTNRTITSKVILREHLKKIRNDGYAVDDEENTDNVRCIAAPIRNNAGEVIYSIGISAPSMRLDLRMVPEHAKIVMSIADEISAQLGYIR